MESCLSPQRSHGGHPFIGCPFCTAGTVTSRFFRGILLTRTWICAILIAHKNTWTHQGLLDRVLSSIFESLEDLSITDYKTKLQEFIQSDSRKAVSYEVVSVEGPSNAPEFEVVVKLDQLIFGRGKGMSKKKAEQTAAKDAFEKLVK